MIRVWSTDWFRDPNGELERVFRHPKRLMAAGTEALAKRSTRIVAVPAGEPVIANPSPVATAVATAHAMPAQGTLFVEQMRTAAASKSGGISVEQARARLIDLRERKVKLLFPEADPTTGLLRKSMLDKLLKKRPTDMHEFRTLIRFDLRQNIDGT